jgi:hypothetical protein
MCGRCDEDGYQSDRLRDLFVSKRLALLAPGSWLRCLHALCCASLLPYCSNPVITPHFLSRPRGWLRSDFIVSSADLLCDFSTSRHTRPNCFHVHPPIPNLNLVMLLTPIYTVSLLAYCCRSYSVTSQAGQRKVIVLSSSSQGSIPVRVEMKVTHLSSYCRTNIYNC